MSFSWWCHTGGQRKRPSRAGIRGPRDDRAPGSRDHAPCFRITPLVAQDLLELGHQEVDIRTTLESDKVLSRTQGALVDRAVSIDGYEIHMGATALGPDAIPLVQLTSRNASAIDEMEGATNKDGSVWGTYFHGLFDFPAFRNHFLQSLNPAYITDDVQAAAEFKQKQYDLLAAHFEKNMNVEKLLEIIGQ